MSTSMSTNILMKMGQLPGIEECLRMFTAVEVLDGENMVGCRRCWKIENGLYKPKVRPMCEDSEDSDESEKSEAKVRPSPPPTEAENGAVPIDVVGSSPPSSPSASASVSSSVGSLEMQSDSTFDTPQSSLSNDATILSKPMIVKGLQPVPLNLAESTSPELPLTTYGGMPIPVISTTAPESPISPPITAKAAHLGHQHAFVDISGLAEALAAPLPLRDSLRAPKITRHRRMPGDADESGEESSDEALDSDFSCATSMVSETSSLASPAVSPIASPTISLERLPPPVIAPPEVKPTLQAITKIPRSKQVIMRPAYKRYLIARPPPILVIHLKRFQQLSKTPMMSFSSGFKKLEDFVAFPELLDIAPFLAPKKEDFGLGKGGKVKFSSKNTDRCMYRLYAVVVHIGNMVCVLFFFTAL